MEVVSEGFKVRKDHYNGITISTQEQGPNIEVADFESKLAAAIKQWKTQGIRGLWVKVDLQNSALVPVCAKLGFDFNHAQPGYVMMTQWLPEKELNLLPQYANQYLGVGGFVVNSKNQVLVIQEKYNIDRKHWKLPGGLADKGEDLATTARREVFEETGIDSEFVSVIAFRHQHEFRFGCSDWYFICLMKPLTEEINFCPQEIGACKWMDIDEYCRDPSLTDANRFFVECYKENQIRSDVAIAPTSVLSFNKKNHYLIYSMKDKPQIPSAQELIEMEGV